MKELHKLFIFAFHLKLVSLTYDQESEATLPGCVSILGFLLFVDLVFPSSPVYSGNCED